MEGEERRRKKEESWGKSNREGVEGRRGREKREGRKTFAPLKSSLHQNNKKML